LDQRTTGDATCGFSVTPGVAFLQQLYFSNTPIRTTDFGPEILARDASAGAAVMQSLKTFFASLKTSH
jgi:hypothetical protein